MAGPKDFIDLHEEQLPADVRVMGADVANDAASVAAAQAAPSGEPSVDFDVRSTFDVRPINAYDFNLYGTAVAKTTATVVTVTFAVRSGYVMVPKILHHWFTPGLGANREDILCTAFINSSAVQDNVGVPVGSASDDLFKLFFIADENQNVSFTFDYTALFPINVNHQLNVHLYGTYILKTGRPAAFEIANPVGNAKHASYGPPLIAPSIPIPALPAPAATITQPAPSAPMTLLPPFADQMVCALLSQASQLPFEQRAAFFARPDNAPFKAAWLAISPDQRNAIATACGVYFSGPSAPLTRLPPRGL